MILAKAPLGGIDGQGQLQWAILERCFSIGSLAFLTLRHSSFRVRWSATVMDEWYNKKGYHSLRVLCRAPGPGEGPTEVPLELRKKIPQGALGWS